MRALIKSLSYLTLCLGLVGWFYTDAAAQPYPIPSDAPIYFIDVNVNAYQSLADFLIQHNRESALKAYVVVAKEILDTEADMYIDKLSAAWQGHRAGFAEEEYLILALGLNRVIEMKFAGKLEARYGVNGKILLDRYFDSDWLPYARAGDYAVGLKNLITRVEAYFKAEAVRNAEQTKRVEEAKEAEAERQARWQIFQTHTLPWLVFPIILLLVVGILLVLRQRHLSIKRDVIALLTKTREKLTLAQSHLNQFYEKYKLLFEIDGEVIYKGKTFEIYQSTSKLVNRLQLGVQLLAQQVGKAEHLTNTQFFTGWNKLEQARYALTDEKVLLSTDEIKTGQVKLFSSMNFSFEAQVSQLMESLENYFAESQSSLDQIWNAILESGPAVSKAKEMNTQIDAQLKSLREAKVALDAYETQRSVILARLSQADQLLKTDPLSAREQALQAQSELQVFLDLVTTMRQTEVNQRELSQKLSNLKEKILVLRKQGFLLKEEGGPDAVCAEAADGLTALRKTLDEADRDKALAIVKELSELLTFVESKLSQTVEAREKIPSESARLRAQSKKLSALARATMPALEELKKEFALEAYKTESDNIDEVMATLNECEKRVALALNKADIKCQEYLGAAALLEQVEHAQKQSEVLLNAIPTKLKELRNIREQSQGLYLELSSQCEQLAQFAKENAFSVSYETEERLSVAQAMLQALTKSMNEPKPDWPVLSQQLQSLRETLNITSAQAQDEKSNFEKLGQLSQELQSKLIITQKYLDAHTEDRAEANSDYQKAQEFLGDIQTHLKQGKSHWAELIKKAIRTTELNELSLSRAKQDVALYEKARSELRQAEQEIRSGDRSFGFGVYAELQPAQQTLQTALSELRVGNYERALSLADEAERSVNEAVRRAYDRSQRMQQELYERRRQEEMARAAMTVASVLFSGGGSSRHRGSGGSGGISFGGGGGGGGSSWGSSSGRSSGWSSSSGRKTW